MEEIKKITEDMVEELAAKNIEILDETIITEGEDSTEMELLLIQEVKYKKIDILL